MSDKELDKLFQQKFETFESVVPAKLWAGISDQLEDKQPKKKMLPVFWMAAASVVLIAFTALWVLNPKAESLKLHGKGGSQVAVNKVPDSKKAATIVKSSKLKEETTEVAVNNPDRKTVKGAVVQSSVRIAPVTSPEPEASTQIATIQNTDPHPVPVTRVYTEAIQSASSSSLVETSPVSNTPVMASLDHTDHSIIQDTPKRKRPSLVGLVNYVVGKVDPREDKLIELSDTDEGTEVSGINLGLLRMKSKRNTPNTNTPNK